MSLLEHNKTVAITNHEINFIVLRHSSSSDKHRPFMSFHGEGLESSFQQQEGRVNLSQHLVTKNRCSLHEGGSLVPLCLGTKLQVSTRDNEKDVTDVTDEVVMAELTLDGYHTAGRACERKKDLCRRSPSEWNHCLLLSSFVHPCFLVNSLEDLKRKIHKYL